MLFWSWTHVLFQAIPLTKNQMEISRAPSRRGKQQQHLAMLNLFNSEKIVCPPSLRACTYNNDEQIHRAETRYSSLYRMSLEVTLFCHTLGKILLHQIYSESKV
jgi:hypothetical protein